MFSGQCLINCWWGRVEARYSSSLERLKAFGYQENAEQAKPSSVWPLSTLALLGVNLRLLAHVLARDWEPLGVDPTDPLFRAGFPAFPLSVALAQAAEQPLHSWAGVSSATGSPQISSGEGAR